MEHRWWHVVPSLFAAAGVVVCSPACQEVDGECWRPTEATAGASAGSGAGGGPIFPPGTGGYGVEPQDADVNHQELPPGCVAPRDAENEHSDNNPDQGTNQGSTCPSHTLAVDASTFAHCEGACQHKCVGAGTFSPSVFKFVTVVPDDGTGVAGGWQQAASTLKFIRWISVVPESWTCSIKVGMPLRTGMFGVISAQQAATITAGVATVASKTVMDLKPPLPPGIYCIKLKAEMASMFASPAYTGLGAKMM